ncbi:hypothetical protein AAHE18_02G061500 [Arachis hypogaea]
MPLIATTYKCTNYHSLGINLKVKLVIVSQFFPQKTIIKSNIPVKQYFKENQSTIEAIQYQNHRRKGLTVWRPPQQNMLCLDAAPKEKTTKMRYRGRRRQGQRRRDTTANDRWQQQKKGTRWRNQGFYFFQQNGVWGFFIFLRSMTGSGFQKPPFFYENRMD